MLKLGIMATSRKAFERRLPIHPAHVQRIDDELRPLVFLETGYGEAFGVSDDELAPHVGGMRAREDLIAECDVILLPKPQAADLAELRPGQILWGWPHCVQDQELTQTAIDSKLTLIAFEAMNHWHKDGSFSLHVLHANNEIAGYASVLHALTLIGVTGSYGRRLRAIVLGFGSTARGAVRACTAMDMAHITVLTRRDTTAVASPMQSVELLQHEPGWVGGEEGVVFTPSGDVPLPEFLAGYDVIVNCVLQDPNRPMMFLTNADLPKLAPGTLVVDVSCDEAMGFEWAMPTDFDAPMFEVGDHVRYYSVDHTPTYLFDSATWEISEALLPHLATVLEGPNAWAADPTVSRAVEIQDGVIRNPDILAFQSRSADYPHQVQR
ncbi:MAG: N(5)-(carboxyethyl)ornithine synthase [Ornithinimicrobium sp.]|uniref:N(5)-(carboxyethyl)ornithine synthase n=1 Tax=Ornithinimicrobium sp. TaxID=1977084 RepID=UPI0026DFC64F|nr:N(5)-(carboxyethyl)ornithine synthase [Ornithinimicrobium sp.]MDO5740607.1 N(5)-(carboxyethyl)ornithine synthase [Ornithinimicrobium sp.]